MRVLLVAAFALGLVNSANSQTAPAVAAGSSLQFALTEIAAKFHDDTGRDVRITSGSSANLATQIQQGAPFEMFLSVNEGFVFQLADAGITPDRGTVYAEGRIVLFAPKGSPLKTDATFSGLRAALAEGRIRKFAIANPKYGTYGRATERALRGQGLWESLQPMLMLCYDVSHAALVTTNGPAQGGIFAYSLALSPSVGALGEYALIPTEWHAPLRQRMVLIKNAGDTAKAFYNYIQQPAAQTILRKFGFKLPGEPG